VARRLSFTRASKPVLFGSVATLEDLMQAERQP
jgi:hypothetical protein